MVVPALLLAAGAFKALGSYSAGQAEAAMNAHNARLARIRARDVMRVAGLDLRRYQQGIGQLIGRQRAGFAAGGVALDSGTPLVLAEDTARIANVDEQVIYINAMLQKWGLEQQADDFDTATKNAKDAGFAGAIGSVLGATGQAFGA
jgi:hypothetical protein